MAGRVGPEASRLITVRLIGPLDLVSGRRLTSAQTGQRRFEMNWLIEMPSRRAASRMPS